VLLSLQPLAIFSLLAIASNAGNRLTSKRGASPLDSSALFSLFEFPLLVRC
jgi:hypothetical protein